MFKRIRPFFAASLSLAAAITSAQLSKPDVLVMVREHKTGAEIVQVTVLNAAYPKELLTAQMEKFGELLGSTPRGLVVQSIGVSSTHPQTFLRADFAVDRLLEPGAIRIEPLLKALAGAPAPYTVHHVRLLFTELGASSTMVKSFTKPGAVKAEASVSEEPPGVQYEIELMSQDAKEIEFPERYSAEKPSESRGGGGRDSNSGALIVLFALTGVGLGALVYWFLLKRATRPRNS